MTRRHSLLVASIAAVAAVAYAAGAARAAGAPTTDPLVYSGTVVDAAGAPTAGQVVSVRLFAAEVGGTSVCNAMASSTSDALGRFSVVLEELPCRAAVATYPDLYLEISLGGTPLPRTHVGAMPYALEADHAVSADEAGRLVARSGSVATTDGVFVGVATYPVGTGYQGARAACRAAGYPATSHMCTVQEVTRTATLAASTSSADYFRSGAPSGHAWVAAGWGGAYYTGTVNLAINDCGGFTSASATSQQGVAWDDGLLAFSNVPCGGGSIDIACCD